MHSSFIRQVDVKKKMKKILFKCLKATLMIFGVQDGCNLEFWFFFFFKIKRKMGEIF